MRWLLPAVIAAGCQHYEQLDPKTVSSLDVIATTRDGKRHRAGSRDDIERDQFDPGLIALSASVGTFHDRAWNPPRDALALIDIDKFTVTASLVADAKVAGTIALEPTWACDSPHVLVTGKSGTAGDAGEAGPGQRNGF